MNFHPVQPGWVVVPTQKSETIPNEWYHVVGWTNDFQPVCAGIESGVFVWRTIFGEDKFNIATLKEWTGE